MRLGVHVGGDATARDSEMSLAEGLDSSARGTLVSSAVAKQRRFP